MINGARSDGDEWLHSFFSGANALKWQSIVDKTAPAAWLSQVMPWLKFLDEGVVSSPIVLPIFSESGPTKWYGVAHEQRVLAQLADEIRAFVGPSYSDFDGQLTELSLADPVEAALRQRFGKLAIAFGPAPRVSPTEVVQRLLLYQSVLARRPPLRDRSLRPFGWIRRDFDSALIIGDAGAAQSALEEMLATGRVSAEQRKCLEVRLLAGLGRYDELASAHGLIAALADLSLPSQTLVDVITALHAVHVAPCEACGDIDAIRACFKDRIAGRYGSLFRSWLGIRDTTVLRSFLLYEAVAQTPDRSRAEALYNAYPKTADTWQLATQILSTIPDAPVSSVGGAVDEARQAIDDEDYERAAQLCFSIVPHIWGYRGLLRCALGLASPELTERVLNLFGSADSFTFHDLTRRDRERLDELQSRQKSLSIAVPSDWLQWARSVEKDAAISLASLETQYPKWSVEEFVADGSRCSTLVSILGNASAETERIFREAFPKLVEFFVIKPDGPSRSLTPMYLMLLQMVGWGGVASQNEMLLCVNVVEALLDAGPDTQSYEDCVDAVGEILKANDAPSSLEWGLNIADALAIHPSSKPERRLQFFAAVVGLCQKWVHRLTVTHRGILMLLAEDFGCVSLLDGLKSSADVEIADSQDHANYAGLVAIYTLASSAGQRAKAMLKRLLPRATIELNEDLVATERLRSLAKRADVFVFAWKKSSHQAYYCAKDARTGGDIAMVPGGGTASIVRMVIDSI